MSKKPNQPRKQVSRKPTYLLEIDRIAPDFFALSASAHPSLARMDAFVDAMDSLGRVVIVRRDAESEGRLYLTSVPQIVDGAQ